MLTNIILSFAALAATALAGGAQLGSQGSGTTPIDDDKVCVPQGAGSWTFAMVSTLTSTGLPTGTGRGTAGSDFNNISEDNAFYILDESCVVRGVYNPGDDQNGMPMWIEENFLPDVLTLTDIDMGVGEGYFSFLYGDGKYSIRNNHCGCQNDNGGVGFNSARQACKCAFPVSGKSS